MEDPLVGEHTFPQCRRKTASPKGKLQPSNVSNANSNLMQNHFGSQPMMISKCIIIKNNDNPAFFDTLACHDFISAYFFLMSLSVELRFLEPEHQSLQEFLMFLFNGPEWMSNSKNTGARYQELAPEKKGCL